VGRIVLRAALDNRRRLAHEALPPDDLRASDWDPVLPHPGRDPELAEALASLPPRQRLIVFLRYFADLSHADIAELVGVEPGTVSATLAQAKAALARRLAPEEPVPIEKEEAR
jgi:DNA-directed RNA polymerase specialized sigma24 family protein